MESTDSKASVMTSALTFYWDLVNDFTLLFILFAFYLLLLFFFSVFVNTELVFISFLLIEQTNRFASVQVNDVMLWK